jgi:hypothetical protein
VLGEHGNRLLIVLRRALGIAEPDFVEPPALVVKATRSQFAPGYYSLLFEDPDGIRVEVNHVPGKGHLGEGGRLGDGGPGPSKTLGEG